MKVLIAVAAHKPYWMPESDIYLPVRAGSAGKPDIGFARDDRGENISEKNLFYCELTALYWVWKNVDCEYLGLAHYRRHFSLGLPLFGCRDRREYVLRQEQLETILRDEAIILPRKRYYFIESRAAQFVNAHGAKEFAQLRVVLESDFSDYLSSFDKTMRQSCGHIFNMFIMRRDLVDAYCAWLFGVLFALDRRLAELTIVPQARIFGSLAERLLDVWLDRHSLRYREIPVCILEPPNWPIKIARFLWRTIKGRIHGVAL